MLYLSILFGLWPLPRCFFDRKRNPQKEKNARFVHLQKRSNAYIQSVWALFGIRLAEQKTTSKIAPKGPSFDNRTELWRAPKCFIYSGLGAFELSAGAFFRPKIEPPEGQKTQFRRPQKTSKCLYIQRRAVFQNSRTRIPVSLIWVAFRTPQTRSKSPRPLYS